VLTGAAVATGAVAHALPVLAQSGPTESVAQIEDIRSALDVAVASPMFKEVSEELQASGFRLSTDAQNLIPTVSKTLDDLIGLALHCEGEVTPRNQADVILTVDMQRKELMGLQVIKGWSWFDTLFGFFRRFGDRPLSLCMHSFKSAAFYKNSTQRITGNCYFHQTCGRTLNRGRSRAIGGTRVWLGKPQILPGVCSWITPHANDTL